MNLLRAFNPKLWDILQPFKAKESEMPWAYQRANPKGRPLHDDWGVMGALPWLQPWQKIARRDCAYRVPLPFRQIEGASEKRWVLWTQDMDYPTAPGTLIQTRPIWGNGKRYDLRHALVDVGIGEGWRTFAAFIGGAWVPCFREYHRRIFGRRFAYYNGLKQDITVSLEADGSTKSDLMAWFPEVSTSWIKTEGV